MVLIINQLNGLANPLFHRILRVNLALHYLSTGFLFVKDKYFQHILFFCRMRFYFCSETQILEGWKYPGKCNHAGLTDDRTKKPELSNCSEPRNFPLKPFPVSCKKYGLYSIYQGINKKITPV